MAASRRAIVVDDALQRWRHSDPVLADLARRHRPQELVLGGRAGFATMAQSIVHQQVSLAAGRTIWGRVEEATGGTPQGFVGAGEQVLRAAGLSRQKVGYCLDLAARTLDGSLDWDALPALADEDVAARLTAVRGIGTWSAKMFLIFHLMRPDVCPWEDLGVRLAVERFYGIPEKEAGQWMRDEARPRWSPHNSLAARVLWEARRH